MPISKSFIILFLSSLTLQVEADTLELVKKFQNYKPLVINDQNQILLSNEINSETVYFLQELDGPIHETPKELNGSRLRSFNSSNQYLLDRIVENENYRNGSDDCAYREELIRYDKINGIKLVNTQSMKPCPFPSDDRQYQLRDDGAVLGIFSNRMVHLFDSDGNLSWSVLVDFSESECGPKEQRVCSALKLSFFSNFNKNQEIFIKIHSNSYEDYGHSVLVRLNAKGEITARISDKPKFLVDVKSGLQQDNYISFLSNSSPDTYGERHPLILRTYNITTGRLGSSHFSAPEIAKFLATNSYENIILPKEKSVKKNRIKTVGLLRIRKLRAECLISNETKLNPADNILMMNSQGYSLIDTFDELTQSRDVYLYKFKFQLNMIQNKFCPIIRKTFQKCTAENVPDCRIDFEAKTPAGKFLSAKGVVKNVSYSPYHEHDLFNYREFQTDSHGKISLNISLNQCTEASSVLFPYNHPAFRAISVFDISADCEVF